MDHSNEKDVCTLLIKYNNEKNEEIILPDFPRLIPGTAKIMSKSIAKIIYDSTNTENNSKSENRKAVIELLSKWADTRNSHLNVNNSNRNIFIKSLAKTRDDKNTICEIFKENINLSTEENIWEEIYHSFESANKINTENKICSDLIRAIDKANLKKTGFECNVPTEIIQNNTFEQSVSFLKEVSTTKTAENKDTTIDLTENELTTDIESSIAFAYGLINLERNEENNKLLEKIVEDIGKKTEISTVEHNFLNYIWTNRNITNLPSEFYITLFKNCQFLYEKPIIELATKILESTIPDYEFESMILNSELSEILNVFNGNDRIINNIKSCLYELLAISCYNDGIFRLINCFKHIIEVNKI